MPSGFCTPASSSFPTMSAPIPLGIVGSASATPAPQAPDPAVLERLRDASRQLESATPQEIIRWAVKNYFPQLTMATAFGPEGCVIIHMLAEIEPRTPVFNLETGYQFKETLELRD